MTTLTATVGATPDGTPAEIKIDQTHLAHGIIFGRTGAGKSVALNTFLTGLSEKHTPEEVQIVYLAGRYPTASIEALPLTAYVFNLEEDRQKAAEYLQDILRERTASPTDDATSIIVVVEDPTPDLNDVLRDITRLGRSLGVHLILVTQNTYPNSLAYDVALLFGWALAFEEPKHHSLEWVTEKIDEIPRELGVAVLSTKDSSSIVHISNVK